MLSPFRFKQTISMRNWSSFVGIQLRSRTMTTSANWATKDTYTHGHQKAVVSQHSSRTLEKNCAYVIPFLKPDMKVLDVGCGPGTITSGIAKRVSHVIGIDASATVIELAKTLAGDHPTNCVFQTGDVYRLPFEDESFDAVHLHMVLQHLSDPVSAIKEMRRVLKPNGFIAAKESDYTTMRGYPILPGIEKWRNVYLETCYRNNAEPRAGSFLKQWFIQGGFKPENLDYDLATMLYDENKSVEMKRNWGYDSAERMEKSDFGKQALRYGLVTEDDVQGIAADWRKWAADPNAVFFYVSGQIIARK